MDITSFLAIVVVVGFAGYIIYLSEKRTKNILDKFIEKLGEKQEEPWKEMIDHPENYLKDDDHVPLEDLSDDEAKKDMDKYLKKTVEAYGGAVDEEAEDARSEIN